MRDPNGVDLDTFPSVMGIITRLACGRAKHEGVDVNVLLRKAGLTHQQIDDPRARLAVKSQIKFINDDCLGFHLAQEFDLRIIGLLHYVLAERQRPTSTSGIYPSIYRHVLIGGVN